jgi:ketosteroid isomerase-like protein
MNAEENKRIAQRAFDALLSGNLDPLRTLLAPNAVLHQCGFLKPIPAQAILQGEFPRFRLIDDRQVKLERIVGEGELVALHWYTSGRYSDPDLPDLDGTKLNFSSMTFIRLEAGQIAEIWNIQDTSTMQSQLRES